MSALLPAGVPFGGEHLFAECQASQIGIGKLCRSTEEREKQFGTIHRMPHMTTFAKNRPLLQSLLKSRDIMLY